MSKIFKEFSFISSSSLIGQLISLLSVLIITSSINSENFGKLTLIYIPTLILPIFLNLGISHAIFRFYNTSNNENDKSIVLNTGILFSILSSILIGAILFLLFQFISLPVYFNNTNFSIILISIFTSNNNILSTTLRANRDFKNISLISILNPIIKFSVIIFIQFTSKLNFNNILFSTLFSELIVFLYLIKKHKIVSSKFSLPVLKEMLIYSNSFIPHKFFLKFKKPLIQILVSNYIGLNYTGYFALAEKMSLPLYFLIDKIQFVWEPVKFEIHKNKNKRSKVFQSIISNLIIIVLFITSFFSFVVFNFLPHSFYQGYEESIVIGYFLFQLCFLRSLYYLFGTGIELNKKMTILPFTSGISLLFLFLFNYIFYQFQIITINSFLISLFISDLISIFSVRFYSKKQIEIRFPKETYIYISFFFASNFYLLVFNNLEEIGTTSIINFLIFSIIILLNMKNLKSMKTYSKL